MCGMITSRRWATVEVRIATFNLENLDETAVGQRPSLTERIALMRPQIAFVVDGITFGLGGGHSGAIKVGIGEQFS